MATGIYDARSQNQSGTHTVCRAMEIWFQVDQIGQHHAD
jgi:hypothetical protein